VIATCFLRSDVKGCSVVILDLHAMGHAHERERGRTRV
jgi:hypothetical protein